MIENNKITFQNFHRKGFMKSLKKKLKIYNTLCKLKITNLDNQSEQNNNEFSEIINKTLQKIETFSKGNFFYLLVLLEEHYDFLEEFRKSVSNLKTIDSLKDSHNTFLQKQKESIKKVYENFISPKILDEETIKKIVENKEKTS